MAAYDTGRTKWSNKSEAFLRILRNNFDSILQDYVRRFIKY